MLPSFALSRPTCLAEAFTGLRIGGVAYAGGTELVAAMNLGLVAPAHLVDLKRIPTLSGIVSRGGALEIGATTRHRDVADCAEVRAHAPILAQACAALGNARVRATGTVGGNLCFADPRSDVSTVLFGLGATVRLQTADGERVLPIEEFVLGAMDVDIDGGELLTSVMVPVATGPQLYLRHQPSEYPTLAIALVTTEHGLTASVGAVGERPQVFTADSVDELDVDLILADLDVIEDLNGSEEYKRHLVAVFVTRAAAKLKERAEGAAQ